MIRYCRSTVTGSSTRTSTRSGCTRSSIFSSTTRIWSPASWCAVRAGVASTTPNAKSPPASSSTAANSRGARGGRELLYRYHILRYYIVSEKLHDGRTMAIAADRLRNFGFLVKDVYRLYAKHFERHAGEFGLTLSQCKVLGHLSRNEGISPARLAELTDTDPMTLVRTLDRMQQDEWIERRPDPADRRAHRLYLCEAAKPIMNLI